MDWCGAEDGIDFCSCVLNADFPPGLVWYYFETIYHDGNVLYWGKNEFPSDAPQNVYQLTVYGKAYNTPGWFCKGVTYHIFIDRFNRGKNTGEIISGPDFDVHADISETPEYLPDASGRILNRDIYGGNLQGIIEKLPYISSLGVTTVYLSPVFEAWSNHKYNTADYKKIDEYFGTEEDFKNLCENAARHGIRIILDGVFSHTGSDSIYFNINGRYPGIGAAQSDNSIYRKWYTFDVNGNYSSWWGIDTLPQVNELEPSYLDFIVGGEDSVIAHWMKAGAAGWRLDVADELPDEFIRRLREKARSVKKDAIIIGEVWEDASNKHAYGVRKKYFTHSLLDGVMNYPIKNAILGFLTGEINAGELCERLMAIIENYPKPVHRCLMNIIGTHDTARAINALVCKDVLHESKSFKANYQMPADLYEKGKRMLRAAANLQFMYPGSPCVYYGDEIATQGFEDPFNRSFFRWDRIDNDMLAYYRKLGMLKKNSPAMQDGDFFATEIDNDCVTVSRNYNDSDFVFSFVNRSKSEKYAYIPITCELFDVFTDRMYIPERGGIHIMLPGYANMVLATKKHSLPNPRDRL